MPRVEEPICSTSPDPHLHLNQKGWHPSGPGPNTKEAATPQVFSPGPRGPHHASLRGCIPAWSHDHVGPLHTRVSGNDHLPHPSNGSGPLLPSGSEPYQDIPTECILPEAHGTLPEGQRTLCDSNAPPHHRNTHPKYWLKWVPTLPMKWTLEWVNTWSPNKVNFSTHS